jgi:hypothetical protein
MKINPIHPKQTRGFIIITVMILAAASLLILTGILNYTTTTANLNVRSNELSLCQNAAEAATEKVYADMAYDFVNSGGIFTVSNKVAAGTYQALVPTAADNPYFTNFNFYSPTSTTAGQIYVSFLTNYAGPLPSQYTNDFASTNSMIYRIVANATMPGSYDNQVIGTAQEDVLFALVPINTYAIFYNGELEFSQCATMTVSGRTHSNADICVGSSADLTFNALVTASTVIQFPERGGDGPWNSGNNNVTYNDGSQTDAVSVQISIPMSNTISMIQIPTNQPSASGSQAAQQEVATLQGQQAEYNQAQVILIITNSPNTVTNSANFAGTNPMVQVILQVGNNQSLPGADPSPNIFYETNMSPSNLVNNANVYHNNLNPYTNFISLPFLSLTNTFCDQRDSSYASNLYVTDIDVGKYAQWVQANARVISKINPSQGQYPTILYVADERNIGTNRLSVVRLTDAQQLPYNNNIGFTVATQNPLYTVGDYNVTTNSSMSLTLATAVGSTTNGNTVPAALICDALTVLSSNWSDSASSNNFASRNPLDTTINAAIVTGNVPSTGTSAKTYSGGVENLTRLLENWSGGNGFTLTYNTSIVCLFSSQMATNQFLITGQNYSYYSAPTRKWGFDPTFYNPSREPPGIPVALVPIRFNWLQPPPGSVTTGIN